MAENESISKNDPSLTVQCPSTSENRTQATAEHVGQTAKEPAPVTSASQLTTQPPQFTKPRFDWYQTHTDVVVNVLVKNVKQQDLEVEFSESNLSVSIKLPSGANHVLDVDLAYPVVADRCTFKILSSKVEIKMRKAEGLQWTTLEKTEDSKVKVSVKTEEDNTIHKYPSSKHVGRDWDKLVANIKKEEKEEKLEGDAALQQLFQQIYKDGSDDVKKAMAKSFSESGGTVLSTNWSEIGSKKTEVKPPDGMEWKEYPK